VVQETLILDNDADIFLKTVSAEWWQELLFKVSS